MNVLLSNCKQNITSLSLLVGTTVHVHLYIISKTLNILIFKGLSYIFIIELLFNSSFVKHVMQFVNY